MKCSTECFTERFRECSQNVSRNVPQMFHAELKRRMGPISHCHCGEVNRLNQKLIHRIRLQKAKARKYFLKTKILQRNARSVPLWRTFKTNLDGLFWIGDVEPAAVAFPTLGEHLDEHAAQRRVGNVRKAIAIGLHV